jgi:hypothetical protein
METGKNNSFVCFGTLDFDPPGSGDRIIVLLEPEQVSFSYIHGSSKECPGICQFSGKSGIVEHRTLVKESIDFLLSKGIAPHRIEVVFTTRETTLIPEILFVEEEKSNLLSSVYAHSIQSSVLFNRIGETGSILVYQADDEDYRLFSKAFEGCSFHHHVGILLDGLQAISLQKKEVLIHTHFFNRHFELYAFQQGKLLFQNHYLYHTSEEIAYYILYAMKQWDLPFDTITVSGSYNSQSDELYWVRKYIEKLTSISSEFFLAFPASLENPGRFAALLNRSWCE